MWRTPQGERFLQGAEWELFREGLSDLWDLVEDCFDQDALSSSGVEAFDDLQPGQKLALLAIVGQTLCDPAASAPPLTAHTEGVVAAVFEHIRQSVQMEIDAQHAPQEAEQPVFWRRLILAAHREAEDAPEEPLPEPSLDDFEEWDILVECLASRILWDADYEMGGEFLDTGPEVGRAQMKAMGIPADYYSAVAPDPAPEQLEDVRRALAEITGRPAPKEPEPLAGVEDSYHGLLVGPCDPAAVDSETACRLVKGIRVSEPGAFDCSYREWVDLFREEVLRAASQGPTGVIDPAAILSPAQLAEARWAREKGEALGLEGGCRIEPRRGGWVVLDGSGYALVEVEGGAWAADEGDPTMPPLVFARPEDAFAAWIYAEALAKGRVERRQLAMKRLGCE